MKEDEIEYAYDIYKSYNLNELLESKIDLKDRKDNLNAQLKETKEEESILENVIIKKMEEQGLTRLANDNCSVTVKQELVPQAEDWESIQNYVMETKDFSLLHRRISSASWNESIKLGKDIPGIKPIELTKLNMRRL